MQTDPVTDFGQINSAHYQLTQAELLFTLRVLNLPDIPGVGEKPWGEMDLDEAQQLFRTAGLALKERGWIWLDENGQAVVEPSLQAMLSVCAYPQQMMALVYRIVPAAPVECYHYRREALIVRHTKPVSLLHDFQSFAGLDMGRKEIVWLFENYLWTYECPSNEISQDAYAQSIEMAYTDEKKTEQFLIESGLSPDVCASFINILVSHKLEIQAQWVYQFDPVVNQNSVIFFADESSCWLVEKVIANKLVRIKAIGSDSLHHLLRSAFNGL